MATDPNRRGEQYKPTSTPYPDAPTSFTKENSMNNQRDVLPSLVAAPPSYSVATIDQVQVG